MDNEQLRQEMIRIIDEQNGEPAHFAADEILELIFTNSELSKFLLGSAGQLKEMCDYKLHVASTQISKIRDEPIPISNTYLTRLEHEYMASWIKLAKYLSDEKLDGKTIFTLSFQNGGDFIIHPEGKDGNTLDLTICFPI